MHLVNVLYDHLVDGINIIINFVITIFVVIFCYSNMATKVPPYFKKYVVKKITSKFKEAVELVTTSVPKLGPTDLLVKNRYGDMEYYGL